MRDSRAKLRVPLIANLGVFNKWVCVFVTKQLTARSSCEAPPPPLAAPLRPGQERGRILTLAATNPLSHQEIRPHEETSTVEDAPGTRGTTRPAQGPSPPGVRLSDCSRNKRPFKRSRLARQEGNATTHARTHAERKPLSAEVPAGGSRAGADGGAAAPTAALSFRPDAQAAAKFLPAIIAPPAARWDQNTSGGSFSGLRF